MSYVNLKTMLKKYISDGPSGIFNIVTKDTLAGQKKYLYNETLPRVINISFNEFTCMYKCRMCPYHDNDVRDMFKTNSQIDLKTIEKIAMSVPNESKYSFDISSIGETLIHKGASDLIKVLKSLRPKVNTILSTNALPLTEKVFRDLVESGLDSIQLSMYAGNKKEHEYVTGTKTFEKVLENIKMTKRVKNQLGVNHPYTQAFMLECEETKDSAKDFIDNLSKYVDKAFLRPLYNLGRQIPGMTPNHKKDIPKKRYPCITPWYSTAIKANGDVLFCYMFHWNKEGKEMIIGNINNNTLSEIWASKKFQEFRDAHLKLDFKNFPLCAKCDLWAAYTNIWDENKSGSFEFKKSKVSEHFIPCTQYRGA